MIRFLAIATVAALIVPAAPAHAGASDVPSVTVGYRDLDLTSTAGRNRLDARIASAARSMCAVHGVRDLRTLKSAKACYRTAIASAQPQLAALAARSKRAAV